MTLLFYPDAGDWVERVRLGPRGFSFTEAAESGTFAMSQVQVDDPLSDITIIGHHHFRALETACSWQTLFRGYFADRTVRRGDDSSLITGAARVWDCTVVDANATLYFEVIRGSAAKRPAETDTQRLAWLLGSAFKGPVSSDDTDVLGYDVDLDKADYRGQTMADVLADCATASKANYWVAWDDAAEEYRLHYYRPTRAYNSSSLRISNVLSDVDQFTTYAPSSDARMMRDPSRIFSGVYLQYGEKNSAVFEESATVLAAIGHRRETAETMEAVRTAARATNKAERYLEEAETDLDTVSVTLRNVPPSRVNLIRAGQRIQIRMTHLPGLTSFAWMRVTRRTVEQDGDNQLGYKLTLELADPKQLGNRRRSRAVPIEPEPEPGTSVTVDRYCYSFATGRLGLAAAFHYETIADETDFAGPGGGIHHEVTQNSHPHNIPWTAGVCALGLGGWGGHLIEEQWFEFTLGSLDDITGLRVTIVIDNAEGYALTDGAQLAVGISPDQPTPYQEADFEVAGFIPAQDGTYEAFIPASLLTPSATQYLAIGANWRCQSSGGSWVCSNEEPLITDVVSNGLYLSGACRVNTLTLTTTTISGTGLTDWTPGEGLADGTNRIFQLVGWNGVGRPTARLGAIVQAFDADFDFDDETGEVTFHVPPPVGTAVAFRYRV